MKKNDVLKKLHYELTPAVDAINKLNITHKEKAQQVNNIVAEQRRKLIEEISLLPIESRGNSALIAQYCITVVGLEYRNKVWPYEYMAFSRRVGELWEAFCSTAWTYPVDKSVLRIEPPSFSEVRDKLIDRIKENIGEHQKSINIMNDVSKLFNIVGEINMKEDEVFKKGNTPYVIDFKSGFGSNEKGNMLRLMTVGRAYKIWNPDTVLMLLVRQDDNNNYLEVLKRSNLWEVHTGSNAYKKIEEITGTDIKSIRENVIDWPNDLSNSFYNYLKGQTTDLTSYLNW